MQFLSSWHKIQGMGKFCDFRLKSPSISETVYEIGPWLLWNVIASHALYRTVTFSMNDLNGPITRFQGHGIFEVECLKNGAA